MADTTSTISRSADQLWLAALDHLESCVDLAGRGDFDLLDGWMAPAGLPAMPASMAPRAAGIAARQLEVLQQMREQQVAIVSEMRTLRRPRFGTADAPSVYIDQSA